MSHASPFSHKPRTRMNGLLFTLLCLIASSVGLVLGLALGIFVAALFSIATGIRSSNVDGAIGLTSAAIGLVLPIVLLVRGRSRTKASEGSSPASSPQSEEQQLLGMFENPESAYRPERNTFSEQELRIVEGIKEAHEDRGVYRFRVRIIDWGFLLYNLLYIPILLVLVVGDIFRKAHPSERHVLLLIIFLPALFTAFHELRGTTINASKLTYPVRIQIYGPFAFPIFRRTIDLERATEATADTKYQTRNFSDLAKLRLVYISGAFIQAKVWFSSKGRRDWLFSQIRVAAPHVRQYRGRW